MRCVLYSWRSSSILFPFLFNWKHPSVDFKNEAVFLTWKSQVERMLTSVLLLKGIAAGAAPDPTVCKTSLPAHLTTTHQSEQFHMAKVCPDVSQWVWWWEQTLLNRAWRKWKCLCCFQPNLLCATARSLWSGSLCPELVALCYYSWAEELLAKAPSRYPNSSSAHSSIVLSFHCHLCLTFSTVSFRSFNEKTTLSLSPKAAHIRAVACV